MLTPNQVLKHTTDYCNEHAVPLNSQEGFVRQILGWREFIRGVYLAVGREERTRNFWGFNRKIPKSFYEGTTGIVPVDETIKKGAANGVLPSHRTADGAGQLYAAVRI
jgi:deoxyribodipyrimidine photolyase-related protein